MPASKTLQSSRKKLKLSKIRANPSNQRHLRPITHASAAKGRQIIFNHDHHENLRSIFPLLSRKPAKSQRQQPTASPSVSPFSNQHIFKSSNFTQPIAKS